MCRHSFIKASTP
jgi:hypothetical protein